MRTPEGIQFSIPTASIVNAASVGSPETQGKGKVAVGFDGSFIFDKNLNFRGAENIDPFPDEDVKNADIERGYQLMLKTSYGVFDNLDVYVKLGWADYKIDSIFQGTRETGVYTFPFVMNTDSDFAYGLGVKGNYEFKPSWLIGYDLQYLRSRHDMYLTKKRTTEAIPATGLDIGTPASMRASVEPQTEPIEVEPLEASASETILMV